MIRIATSNLYSSGTQGIGADQSAVVSAMAQLSSGKQVNSPADDPAGAAQASSLQSDLSQLTQYRSNQGQATSLLNMGSSALTQVVNVIQGINTSLVQAGDPTYTDSQRGAIAVQLQQQLNQLVGLANSGDGQGGYLFAGSRTTSPPFVQNGNSVAYGGDSIVQGLQISATRAEQVKYAGDSIFNNIPTGNGSFVTAVGGNGGGGVNLGNATIDAGSVTSPAALTGDKYTITFGSGTYSVYDSSKGANVAGQQNVPYTSPASISFDGMTMQVSGSPLSGDTFTVGPSGYQSLFDMVASAIALLQTPSASAASAQRSAKLSGLLGSVGQALAHISTVQASMGSQISELDSYQSINADRTQQDQSRLSAIVDLDYAKGVSNLQRQQLQYQAALQSYSAISKLSLFNYL